MSEVETNFHCLNKKHLLEKDELEAIFEKLSGCLRFQ